MSVSYKKLWKMLIDRDMKKKDLQAAANISNYTISKLNRGDNVTTDVLARICISLGCEIGDIMEVMPNEREKLTSAVNNRVAQVEKVPK